jgi:cytochrome c peroxidase
VDTVGKSAIQILLFCIGLMGFCQADSLTPALGYTSLPFPPPLPGSYVLSKMGVAGSGRVIDSQGKSLELHQLYGDKLVLLSFIYATCDDINGCPLATSVLHQIKSRFKNKPEIFREAEADHSKF